MKAKTTTDRNGKFAARSKFNNSKEMKKTPVENSKDTLHFQVAMFYTVQFFSRWRWVQSLTLEQIKHDYSGKCEADEDEDEEEEEDEEEDEDEDEDEDENENEDEDEDEEERGRWGWLKWRLSSVETTAHTHFCLGDVRSCLTERA